MRSLTIILALLGICVFLGCTIVQREATTAKVGEDIFTRENKLKVVSTSEKVSVEAKALKANNVITKKERKQKYCLKCGRRFLSSTEYCPYDGAELRPIDRKK